MSQHTPGPWSTRETSAGQALIASEANGTTVAVAYNPGDGPVLAAAPELLVALRALFDVLTVSGKHSYRPDSETGRAIATARAAIAKTDPTR